MISARQILTKWCDKMLSSYKLDTVELKKTSPDDMLDKVTLVIEHGNFVASFTAWGEQGTTEWLVMDIQSGETIVTRDEEFSNAMQLELLVEKAMMDIQQFETPPMN
jgi:hypothetical protein